MMASLKKLLEEYKLVNPEFRHYYNGDTWNVWLDRGDYPDYQNLTNDDLDKLIRQKLSSKVDELVGNKRSIEAKIQIIKDALLEL